MKKWPFALCFIPAHALALGLTFGVSQQTSAPVAGTIDAYQEYGQSYRANFQSSASDQCLGEILTPAGAGQLSTITPQSPQQQFMLNNSGAPGVGLLGATFPSTKVTGLLPIEDCGPDTYRNPQQIGAQLLVPTEINMLQTLDAGAGRGTVYRLGIASGVGGTTVVELSKPTVGETCDATDTGPQCRCYNNAGAPGIPNGTNGARCVFSFNQAFVGPTSMLGSACAQIALRGALCRLRAIDFSQGNADTNTPQSTYATPFATLLSDINTAVKATSGQSQDVDFLIQLAPSHIGNSYQGVWKAQLAYCEAHPASNVHCTGPSYQFHAFGGTFFHITGDAHVGNSSSITFHVNGSDTTVTTTMVAGDVSLPGYFVHIAANINATAALTSKGLYAISGGAGDNVQVYQTITNYAPFTVTAVNTISGSFTQTFAYPLNDGHQTNIDKVFNAEHNARCLEDILESHECPYLDGTAVASGNSVVITYDLSKAPRLTSPIAIDTTFLPQAAGWGYSFEIGTEYTTQASGGTTTLYLGAQPLAFAAVNQYVFDRTCPSCITAGTKVTALDPSNGRITTNNATTAAQGDEIAFEDCASPPTITGIPVVSSGNIVTVPLSGSPSGCTFSYAWSGTGQHNGGPVDSFGGTQQTGTYGAWGNIRDSYAATGSYSGYVDHNWAMPRQWAIQ
jgi:hypothetical protein